MEQQQMREIKQREKEHLLRQLVKTTDKSTTEARATQNEQSETPIYAQSQSQSAPQTPPSGLVYQTPAQPPTTVSQLGSAVQHDLEIAQAADTSIDMSLIAQYEALDDLPPQPKASPTQSLIVGPNYHEIQQEMIDIQLARNAEVDVHEELNRDQIEQNRQRVRQQLADLSSAHPIAAITGSPASSSFDLSRELSAMSPPKTPSSSPVPVGDTPGVSPIPIAAALPKSPPLTASSPPKRPYVRAASRAGSSTETRDPETGVPSGKAVRTKPKGRPPGSKNKR